jgi:putative addiction module component (TIGR02574 family)
MSGNLSISEVLALSVAERILLVEEIWDSIARFPEALQLTEAQRQELDARLDAYRKDPAAGSSWVAAKARIARSGRRDGDCFSH